MSNRTIIQRVRLTPRFEAVTHHVPRIVGLLAERATTLLQRQPADFTPSGLHLPDAPCLGPVTTDTGGFIQRISLEKLLSGPLRALFAPLPELALS